MTTDNSFSRRRLQQGAAARSRTRRRDHAHWNPSPDRRDPRELLQVSNEGRLVDLVGTRFDRMSESPFAFFRGSAIVMANDLTTLPNTGILVQSCGDCHLQNFGWLATPERNLAFDLTDFDETTVAPWEWDLKRLAVSFFLAGKSDTERRSLTDEIGRTYRTQIAEFGRLSVLETWYARLDVAFLLDKAATAHERKSIHAAAKKARSQTMDKWLPKLTCRCGDKLRFKDETDEITRRLEPEFQLRGAEEIVASYRDTIQEDRRELLSRYQLVDVVFKIVGIGSVGLRCLVALLLDDQNVPLVLQIKEAQKSVLAPFVEVADETHQGHRIVRGQRLMQAASDPFLGWGRSAGGRDYYVRQLRDMKLSWDPNKMTRKERLSFAKLCGCALARAHAKSGKSLEIAGYLGTGDRFDRALSKFAAAYAVQVESDFATFLAAGGA